MGNEEPQRKTWCAHNMTEKRLATDCWPLTVPTRAATPANTTPRIHNLIQPPTLHQHKGSCQKGTRKQEKESVESIRKQPGARCQTKLYYQTHHDHNALVNGSLENHLSNQRVGRMGCYITLENLISHCQIVFNTKQSIIHVFEQQEPSWLHNIKLTMKHGQRTLECS